jgi:hypothetical protein
MSSTVETATGIHPFQVKIPRRRSTTSVVAVTAGSVLDARVTAVGSRAVATAATAQFPVVS